MNKFVVICIIVVVVIISGIIYKNQFRPADIAPIVASGKTVLINMKVAQNTWKWDPDTITVQAGDTVILKIANEDTYDHGFGLEIFGVNKRIFAKTETEITFIASKIGTFNFYCSVSCGAGHYTQTGHLTVTE